MGNSVLLVNPPFSSFKHYVHSDFQEPLGLLFLAGYLRSKGVDIDVVDFFSETITKQGDYFWQGNSEAQIESDFRRRQPRIVGISSMFSVHCHAVHRVAAIAKRAIPNVLVVVGGTHASAFPRKMASDPNIDIVVVGEGEQTLHEIVAKHTQGCPLDNVDGIAFIDKHGCYRAGL